MRRLGWVMFAATCVFVAAQGIMLAASDYSMLSTEVLVSASFPLVPIGALIGAAVGALIVSRYPRNAVGWLFCIGQLGSAISLAAGAFSLLVAQGVVDAPTAGRAAVYADSYFNAVFTAAVLAVIFIIAPDGRLLSRRWRLALPVPILAWGLHATVVLAASLGFFDGANPDQAQTAFALELAGIILLLVALALGSIALWLRLRRSAGERRRQLRWIVASAAFLTANFTVVAVANVSLGEELWPLQVLLHVAYIGVTVSVGVAILRYRLYDIDVILSRAIVLGVLAVFVTVGYIGVVVAIGAVLAAVGAPGSSLYWPSLVATALVAAAFQPARRHVLRLADQLVYGNRAAPYEALASLSRRLADSPSPEAIPERVAEATGRAVGAVRTVVRLGEPGGDAPVRTAIWNGDKARPATGSTRDTGTAIRVPVLDMDEQIGSIEVSTPPGRELRAFERNLLQDVAGQAGVAFRNALLEAELAARVADVQRQSVELAASRRRLLGVEDEAREGLSAAIRRGVVPHLAAVERALGAPSAEADADRQIGRMNALAADPDGARSLLEGLIGEIERALEELRTVCRGVFPALLERRGLIPALSAQLDAAHPLAVLDVDDSADHRLNRAAEAAAYQFCIDVTPTDRRSLIALRVEGDRLIATVSAQGSWAAVDQPPPDPARRALPVADDADAWQHARDRVAALDGEVRVGRNEAGHIQAVAVIPLGDQAPQDLQSGDRRPAMAAANSAQETAIAAQTSSSRSGPNADFGT
jgi:hypothetical protein